MKGWPPLILWLWRGVLAGWPPRLPKLLWRDIWPPTPNWRSSGRPGSLLRLKKKLSISHFQHFNVVDRYVYRYSNYWTIFFNYLPGVRISGHSLHVAWLWHDGVPSSGNTWHQVTSHGTASCGLQQQTGVVASRQSLLVQFTKMMGHNRGHTGGCAALPSLGSSDGFQPRSSSSCLLLCRSWPLNWLHVLGLLHHGVGLLLLDSCCAHSRWSPWASRWDWIPGTGYILLAGGCLTGYSRYLQKIKS